MRDDLIEQEQKQDTESEADESGQKRQSAAIGALIHRGDQQAPDRRRDHHAAGKPGQRTLDLEIQFLFHKEHARRAERCSDKRDRYPFKNI